VPCPFWPLSTKALFAFVSCGPHLFRLVFFGLLPFIAGVFFFNRPLLVGALISIPPLFLLSRRTFLLGRWFSTCRFRFLIHSPTSLQQAESFSPTPPLIIGLQGAHPPPVRLFFCRTQGRPLFFPGLLSFFVCLRSPACPSRLPIPSCLCGWRRNTRLLVLESVPVFI